MTLVSRKSLARCMGNATIYLVLVNLRIEDEPRDAFWCHIFETIPTPLIVRRPIRFDETSRALTPERHLATSPRFPHTP